MTFLILRRIVETRETILQTIITCVVVYRDIITHGTIDIAIDSLILLVLL